ncbi:polynucleotide adenylyltransferase, partial [Ceratobasidium sp. 370]
MVSTRRRAAALLVSSSALVLNVLANPYERMAYWKRSISPPLYPRQQDCIPPEPVETVTDRLNTLLNSSGPGYILPLCQNATYRLTAPLVYAAENQEISTVGYPIGDERATLLVDGFWNDTNGHSVAVQGNCIGCNGIVLRHVQINGSRNGRPPISGGGNIEFGGPNANQLIEYVHTYDPRSWTCLHISEGVLNCTNTTIQMNEIGPCGSDLFATWADGISLSCRNSVVRGNWIDNPTDGGIVLFGSPGSLVQNNTIWIENNTLLGGINLVDYDPFNGDFTGTIVENNTIIGGFATDQPENSTDIYYGDNDQDVIIKMGLAVGNRVWFGEKYGLNRNFGGIVRNNQLTGAFGWGVAVSGVRDFTVENNELIGNTSFIGYRGVNCSITATSGPSKAEEAATEALMNELRAQNTFESEEEARRRESVLGMVHDLVQKFVQRVSLSVGMSEQAAKAAGGKIFTFGSYRLGVHGPGSDIDTLCVVPKHVTYTDFFSTFEPMLKEMEGATEVAGVPEAFVPIVKAEIRGIPIDFLLASLNRSDVPEDLSLEDNKILAGLDERTVRSLGGSRVTDDILRLVPNVSVFRDSLRCIKLWAQRRAIYSNVNGFLGGVAWAMLVARICQLYPNLNAAAIIHRFFIIMLQWKWPQPILLRQIEEEVKGLGMSFRVWNPRLYPTDRNHLMPIITPAYPSMCSTHNVTRSTMSVMMDEFTRGAHIVEQIMYKRAEWSELFSKHDFFQKYRYYLQIIASSGKAEDQLKWSGTVESRLRQLVMKLEFVDQLEVAHPFVKGFEQKHYCLDDSEVRAVAQGDVSPVIEKRKPEDMKSVPNASEVYTTTFYIGMKVAEKKAGTSGPRKLDISYPTTEFTKQVKQWDQYHEETHGIVVRHIRSSALPDHVFDGGVRPVVIKSLKRPKSSK